VSKSQNKRIVVFGVTGHLGQQLIDNLAESDWPIAELVGVASIESAGMEFQFRGEALDVVSEWPVLKGWDLVFICTPAAQALEVVREALRAEVPCVDCTGALSNQAEVPMPMPASMSTQTEASLPLTDDIVATTPLLSVASGTTLAWAPILEALAVTRVVGTVLCSVSSRGRRGVLALSQESIALFNQAETPDVGPAGQTVAFDVIPGGGIDCDRVRAECRRLFGEDLRVGVASVQVPTFVGEGASLALELAEPLAREDLETRLIAKAGLLVARDGLGSRGLAVVEEDAAGPIGPTLRDVIGSDEILIGRIEADRSLPDGVGWRFWIAFDPLRLVADQALRLASRRLGLS
jgi:aspartate-semialdehyde dehydrogenase